MKAILVEKTGGPEVLVPRDVNAVVPGHNEVLIRNHAIGVNFTDVYARSGALSPGEPPFIPGKEGAGVVEDVGAGVCNFKIGDRVAYVETPGAYAELHAVPEHFVVPLPDEISFTTAAACLLKGLTAHFLIHRTFPVRAGHTILVHAAAGGVGSILTQWAKHKGARVIGTVGSAEKAVLARNNGCDDVINYREESFVERVMSLTQQNGCDVVYDSVGKDTFPGSLDCLKPFGYFVCFGFASGPVPPFDIRLLAEKGSLYATWPGLTMYLRERQDVLAMSRQLFDAITEGTVMIPEPTCLALNDAEKAHRLLESRSVTRTMVLIP